MTVFDDLSFIEAFIAQYGDSDATAFTELDPMTGLSEGMNNLRAVTEGRADMAGPLQDLLLALRGSI